MNSTKLETYLLVCKEKSFTKAADKLFITPAAVKKQVDSLEAEVGVKLLHRSSFGCLPTSAGIVFQEHARGILRAVRESIEAVQQENRIQTREIKVGHSVKLEYGFISDAIGCYSEHCPNQSIRFDYMRKAELLSALQHGLIDCFLFINPHKKDFLQIPSSPISTTKVHAVMQQRHPLSRRKLVSLEDLAPYDVYVSAVLDRELYESLEPVVNTGLHVLDKTDRNDLAVSLHRNAVFLYPCPAQHNVSVPYDYPALEIRLYYMRHTPAIDELAEILRALLKSDPNRVLL